uniref:CSON015360 protein n=1 Tax=Culicoides sonorensis TaxID=179676 RepID=A0A336MD11_CULSO
MYPILKLRPPEKDNKTDFGLPLWKLPIYRETLLNSVILTKDNYKEMALNHIKNIAGNDSETLKLVEEVEQNDFKQKDICLDFDNCVSMLKTEILKSDNMEAVPTEMISREIEKNDAEIQTHESFMIDKFLQKMWEKRSLEIEQNDAGPANHVVLEVEPGCSNDESNKILINSEQNLEDTPMDVESQIDFEASDNQAMSCDVQDYVQNEIAITILSNESVDKCFDSINEFLPSHIDKPNVSITNEVKPQSSEKTPEIPAVESNIMELIPDPPKKDQFKRKLIRRTLKLKIPDDLTYFDSSEHENVAPCDESTEMTLSESQIENYINDAFPDSDVYEESFNDSEKNVFEDLSNNAHVQTIAEEPETESTCLTEPNFVSNLEPENIEEILESNNENFINDFTEKELNEITEDCIESVKLDVTDHFDDDKIESTENEPSNFKETSSQEMKTSQEICEMDQKIVIDQEIEDKIQTLLNEDKDKNQINVENLFEADECSSSAFIGNPNDFNTDNFEAHETLERKLVKITENFELLSVNIETDEMILTTPETLETCETVKIEESKQNLKIQNVESNQNIETQNLESNQMIETQNVELKQIIETQNVELYRNIETQNVELNQNTETQILESNQNCETRNLESNENLETQNVDSKQKIETQNMDSNQNRESQNVELKQNLETRDVVEDNLISTVQTPDVDESKSASQESSDTKEEKNDRKMKKIPIQNEISSVPDTPKNIEEKKFKRKLSINRIDIQTTDVPNKAKATRPIKLKRSKFVKNSDSIEATRFHEDDGKIQCTDTNTHISDEKIIENTSEMCSATQINIKPEQNTIKIKEPEEKCAIEVTQELNDDNSSQELKTSEPNPDNQTVKENEIQSVDVENAQIENAPQFEEILFQDVADAQQIHFELNQVIIEEGNEPNVEEASKETFTIEIPSDGSDTDTTNEDKTLKVQDQTNHLKRKQNTQPSSNKRNLKKKRKITEVIEKIDDDSETEDEVTFVPTKDPLVSKIKVAEVDKPNYNITFQPTNDPLVSSTKSVRSKRIKKCSVKLIDQISSNKTVKKSKVTDKPMNRPQKPESSENVNAVPENENNIDVSTETFKKEIESVQIDDLPKIKKSSKISFKKDIKDEMKDPLTIEPEIKKISKISAKNDKNLTDHLNLDKPEIRRSKRQKSNSTTIMTEIDEVSSDNETLSQVKSKTIKQQKLKRSHTEMTDPGPSKIQKKSENKSLKANKTDSPQKVSAGGEIRRSVRILARHLGD